MTPFVEETLQFIETGREPEYFVTDIRLEHADASNMRVMAYAKRRGTEMHLLYTAVMPKEKAPAMIFLLMQYCGCSNTAGLLPDAVTTQ